ncbi:hypothetical protein OEM_15150 [Mycobacterium intracellulare subsp. yongonense 05-1390]|nr:hypothetical protein OEM_15150 [Mycobacterium intracellulare subsp. yongonense 05-1390]
MGVPGWVRASLRALPVALGGHPVMLVDCHLLCLPWYASLRLGSYGRSPPEGGHSPVLLDAAWFSVESQPGNGGRCVVGDRPDGAERCDGLHRLY